MLEDQCRAPALAQPRPRRFASRRRFPRIRNFASQRCRQDSEIGHRFIGYELPGRWRRARHRYAWARHTP